MACYEAADVLKVNPLTSSSQGGRSGRVGLGEGRFVPWRMPTFSSMCLRVGKEPQISRKQWVCCVWGARIRLVTAFRNSFVCGFFSAATPALTCRTNFSFQPRCHVWVQYNVPSCCGGNNDSFMAAKLYRKSIDLFFFFLLLSVH